MRLLLLLTVALITGHALAESPIATKPIDRDFTLRCQIQIFERVSKDKYRSAVKAFYVKKQDMDQLMYFTLITTAEGWVPHRNRLNPDEKHELAHNLVGHIITIRARKVASIADNGDGNNEFVSFDITSPVKIGRKTTTLSATGNGSLRGYQMGTTLQADTGKEKLSAYLNCNLMR